MASLVVKYRIKTVQPEGNHRLSMWVSDYEDIDPFVFVHQRMPPVPNNPTPEDVFVNVASVADLNEYPTHNPSNRYPFFRLTSLDLIFRSVPILERTLKNISSDLDCLIHNLNALEEAGTAGTLYFGAPVDNSSSSSSSSEAPYSTVSSSSSSSLSSPSSSSSHSSASSSSSSSSSYSSTSSSSSSSSSFSSTSSSHSSSSTSESSSSSSTSSSSLSSSSSYSSSSSSSTSSSSPSSVSQVSSSSSSYGEDMLIWWKFDETNVLESPKDSSVRNHASSRYLNVDINQTGRIGRAYLFNDGYVAVDDPANHPELKLGPEFTLMAWIYTTDLSGSAWQGIIGAESQGIAFGLNPIGGQLRPRLTYVNVKDFPASSYVVSESKWIHLAVVVTVTGTGSSDGHIAYYVDGALHDTVIFDPNQPAADGTTFIAGRRTATVNPFYGKLDDIRIMQRALTAGEIAYYYDNVPPYVESSSTSSSSESSTSSGSESSTSSSESSTSSGSESSTSSSSL